LSLLLLYCLAKDNYPLILGLSIGIGVPLMLGILGGFIYYLKVMKPKQKVVISNGSNTILLPPVIT
jgi:hypothetical protein